MVPAVSCPPTTTNSFSFTAVMTQYIMLKGKGGCWVHSPVIQLYDDKVCCDSFRKRKYNSFLMSTQPALLACSHVVDKVVHWSEEQSLVDKGEGDGTDDLMMFKSLLCHHVDGGFSAKEWSTKIAHAGHRSCSTPPILLHMFRNGNDFP